MADDVSEKEFAKFRPHCLVLASTPNKAVLDKLEKLVDEEDPKVLENIQNYLIFPQQLYLKTPSLPSNYTIAVLQFIRSYFKKTRLNNFFILKDVLGSCLVMISKSDHNISKEGSNKKEGGISEDLKVTICECLEKLLVSADQNVLEEFFSENSKLSLSHLVFTCLSWAEKDKAAVVKSSCISLINSVCCSFTSLPPSTQATNILLSVLPGILSKLAKVTQDTSVLQTKVKIQAVETWTLYVKTLINDKTLSQAQQLPLDHASTPLQPSLLSNPKWAENAANQILSQLKLLHDLSFHSQPSLRHSMADLSITLCQSSWSALSSSFPTLLNILVALSVDEREEIRLKSLKGLDYAVQRVREEDNMDTVCVRTNQSLFDLSKEVGRCLGLYQQEKLGRSIALLKGNLILLNRIEEESVFFMSKVHLRCLVHSLIKVAELDETHHVLTGGAEDFSTLEFLASPELYLTCKRPEKSFVHLTTPSLVRSVRDICGILGSCQSFYIVVEYLLEGIEELERYQREAVILLNEVIAGAVIDAKDDIDETVKETCLSVINAYLSITPGDHNTSVSKLGQENERSVAINEDWTVVSLIIEGLAKIVKILGDDLPIYLPMILTYIMTHTDLANRHATHVFYFSLQDIAVALDQDIVHVLRDNVDHLNKDLNLLLRKQELGPCLPTLLKVVLKVSGADTDMADLQDTVESLMKNLALCSGQRTLEILKVIRIFVFSFKQKTVKPSTCDKPNKPEEKESDSIGSVTKMIQKLELDRAAEAKILQDLDTPFQPCPEEGFHSEKKPSEDNVEEAAEEENEEVTAPPPTEKQIFLKSVLDSVKNFVSMSGQPEWQLASLDIVTCSIDLLAYTPGQLSGERQDQLLPLVHDLWHPLKLLFKSNNIFIVDKAFECLVVIAEHARDFVHKRTVTDVFPPLLKFFHTLQVMVGDRDRQTTLAATQSRRILSRLVSGLWTFLHLLDLGPLESDPLIGLLLDHLGDKLGTGETEFLKPKRNLDANILWLKMHCKEQ